ncbi:MAG: hypothetical protein KDA79_10130, partial [Planctomycetaceae bacterium]|nr:hypothetical protein [Planctomycetaceae bacterium]
TSSDREPGGIPQLAATILSAAFPAGQHGSHRFHQLARSGGIRPIREGTDRHSSRSRQRNQTGQLCRQLLAV